MEFKDRVARFPGQKKLTKVNPLTGEAIIGETPVYVTIDREEGEVTENGTALNAENLNKGNWRDDKSVSFTAMNNNELPAAKPSQTQIVTKLNGETWLVPPAGNGGSIQLGKVTESVDHTYPVGSIYLSVNAANPGMLFGGTWTSWGAGRVIIGMGGNGETNYDIPEYTGGSENSVATHTHIQEEHSHAQVAHSHGLISPSPAGNIWTLNANSLNNSTNNKNGYVGALDIPENQGKTYHKTNSSGNVYVEEVSPVNSRIIVTNNDTGITGGNRQPFITCYMWKRVS